MLFHLSSSSELKYSAKEIVDCVAKNGFAIIRGFVDHEDARRSLGKVYELANRSTHRASAGVSPAEIRQNMTKWSIGGESKTQSGLPRFMLTVYNPLFKDDVFGLHPSFQRLVEVRDTLAGRQVQTDEMLAPERFNGCRVQIYPAGGGFMGSHEDTRAASNLAENSGPYIQLVLLLTERGTDFKTGGAHVTLGSASIDSEADGKSGDIIVYDGSTKHGVADIDPDVAFNMNDLRGRAVALATIYNFG